MAAVTIEIRNVPAKVLSILKARAAMAGKSLSDYLLEDLKRSVERPTVEKPTMEQWLANLRKQIPVELSVSVVDLLREDRDG